MMRRTLYVEFATPQNVAPKLTICNLKVLVAEDSACMDALPLWIKHSASLILCIETGSVFKSTLVQAATFEQGFKLGDSSVANFEVLNNAPTVELGTLYRVPRDEDTLELVAELVITKEEDLLIHLTVLNPTEKTVKAITDWVSAESVRRLRIVEGDDTYVGKNSVRLLSSSLNQYRTDSNHIFTFSTYKV